MSRIRTIKPEFWSSEQLVSCSHSARLLFIGLWNFCDDAGRKPASLMRLKMEVLPGDDINIEKIGALVNELNVNKLLREYSVEGKKYWQVTGWHHQKIDKPTIKYPSPPNTEKLDEHSANSSRIIDDDSTTAHPRSLNEGSLRESKEICRVASAPQQLSLEPLSHTGAITSEEVKTIFIYWQKLLKHPKAVLDKARSLAINKALKNYSAEQLKKAIEGCSKDAFNMGDNKQKKRYDDISLILRDSAHIEKFISQAETADNCLQLTTAIPNTLFAGAI